MTLDEFRRHPAYDYYIISVPCDIADESEEYIQSCNYCPLVKYLCLGIDCHAVILKQIKYEKK